MAEYKFSHYIKKRQALSSTAFGINNTKLEATIQNTPISGENLLKWIYDVLAILDTKASALMRLNGVMLATTTFMLIHGATLQIKVLIIFNALPLTLSIILCLFVVNVDWPFLGKAKMPKTPDSATEIAGQTIDFTEEFSRLESMIGIRTLIYRWAWGLSLFAAVAFIIALAIYLSNQFVI
ncbi:hypothetical protein [Pseudomonas allokribbensis]|uniref:hypothetical protein n=1 Tax=Pseudomonas allokribbensis TaxID=2774460 RepID=UPI0017889A87|nr:hypothetical protein [Pseudomonas allokribbensis]